MSRVISVENLSKAYQLGEFSSGSIAQDLKRKFALLQGKEDPFLTIGEVNDRTVKSEARSNVVWSLKDLTFDIEHGDTIGIIGKNGAGKSTLLKILSQITSPTTGSVKIKGRVASLLEVGTGFHPELSGRENIFLNGAILGMRKKEIVRKFDEIVDFSGVERYIDTPVKRYSSGMYVRLAFAVAAHLESEILIVDEVLAVGDADFQKKCLGKMDDVSKGEGRTILFVSHNLPMLAALCKKGIVLQHGNLVFNGSAAGAMQFYQNGENMSDGKMIFEGAEKVPGDEFAELLEVRIERKNSSIGSEIDIADGFKIIMRYRLKAENSHNAFPNFHFFDQFGQYVFVSSPSKQKLEEQSPKGEYIAVCNIPANFLNAGNFSVGAALTLDASGARTCFWEKNVLNFTMVEDLENSPTRIGQYGGAVPGVIRPLLNWDLEKINL